MEVTARNFLQSLPKTIAMIPRTRFLVVSDTHGKWPYTEESPPKANVLLHCGDLTQVGGLPSFKRAMEHLKAVDAELKLFIAGNHNLELDEAWVRKNAEEKDADVDQDLADGKRCVEYMRSLRDDGIYYLEEGVSTSTLKSGHAFSVYASPYTPEFCDYALAYGKDEDRFNKGPQSIPANVDIVMTHGPPAFKSTWYGLDLIKGGKHVGCEKLAKAIERLKPHLHCFSHIHKERGATRIEWSSGGEEVANVEPAQVNSVLCVNDPNGTLFVNAAINAETDEGFVIEMELSS